VPQPRAAREDGRVPRRGVRRSRRARARRRLAQGGVRGLRLRVPPDRRTAGPAPGGAADREASLDGRARRLRGPLLPAARRRLCARARAASAATHPGGRRWTGPARDRRRRGGHCERRTGGGTRAAGGTDAGRFTLEGFRRKTARVRELADAAGRDPATLTFSGMFFVQLAETAAEAERLRGAVAARYGLAQAEVADFPLLLIGTP